MLTLEQAVKNIIVSNGVFVIPLSAFSFDWDTLNVMFEATLSKFEKWKPLNKRLYTTVSPSGIVLEDALEVKCIAMMSGNMIPAQVSPFQSDDFYFDPVTKLLQSVGTSQYLVVYLGKYTRNNVSLTDTYHFYANEECSTMQLQAVPNLSTIEIKCNDETLTLQSKQDDEVEFESTSYNATLDISALSLTVQRNAGLSTACDVTVNYTTKYKAIMELDSSDEFFETWLGSILLSSLGSIKAITKFDSMPVDISADDMLAYGRQLKETVNTYQIERSRWTDIVGI